MNTLLLGEKGIWNKWTLFEHSTRVPLIIVDPQSAFRGYHYEAPVELIDVVPTVLDLLGVDKEEEEEEEDSSSSSSRPNRCKQQPPKRGRSPSVVQPLRPACRRLDGKSLAPVLRHQPSLQSSFHFFKQWLSRVVMSRHEAPRFIPPFLEMNRKFALTQKVVCAHKKDLRRFKLMQRLNQNASLSPMGRTPSPNPWKGCTEFSFSDKYEVRLSY
jgi:hypothetical protein